MRRFFSSLRMGFEAIVGLVLVLNVLRTALSDPLRARLAQLADVGVTLIERTAEATFVGVLALLIALVLLWDAHRLSRKLAPPPSLD